MNHLRYELSPSQQKGMDLTRDIGMIAGAGSGKTRVLTERYLAILDRLHREFGTSAGTALASIVAITYTRKASAEMRERIAESCMQLAANSRDDFWSETGLKMAEARISTIHRFCARIISEYPIEAAMEPDNLEGGTPGDTVLRAANRYCRALSNSLHPLYPKTRELVRLVSWSKLPELLTTAFDKRTIFLPYIDNLPESPEILVETWRKKAERLAEKIDPGKFDLLENIHGDLAEFDQIGSQNDELARIIGSLSKLVFIPESISIFFDIKQILCEETGELPRFGHIGSGGNWPSGTIRNARRAVNDLRDALDEIMFLLPAEPRDADYNNARAMILFGEIFRGFLESENANLPPQTEPDFVDLLIGANRIVVNEDSATSIASGLKGLLVDEFQDTDPLQWDTISRLADKLAGKLFWVGDPKQSIYRFRGADVANVEKAKRFVENRNGEIYTMDDNYRTTPAVLGFVNHVAGKFLAEPPLIDLDFHAIPQKLNSKRKIPNKHSGSVEIMISGDKLPLPESNPNLNLEAELIARRIYSAVLGDVNGEGFLNVDEGNEHLRPANWGDIAVLYPTRSSMEDNLREALLARDIPFMIIGGQDFYVSEETAIAQKIIFYLDDNQNDPSLFSILRGPLFSLPDTVLYAASLAGEGSIREGLRVIGDSGQSHRAESYLTEEELQLAIECDATLENYEKLSPLLPPSRLVSHIMTDRGMWAYFRAQLNGEQRIANMEKFLRILSKFDSKGLSRAVDHFWAIRTSDEKEREEAVETEGRNAVRLMTVHQAKGLEFPIVIAANLSVNRRGRTRSMLLLDDFMGGILKASLANADDNGHYYELFRKLDLERDVAETKRVLYVAMTRARDHLILSGKKPGGRYLDLITKNVPLEIPETGREKTLLQTDDGEIALNISAGVDSWQIPPKEPQAGTPVYLEILSGKYSKKGVLRALSIPETEGRFYIPATYLPFLLNSPREILAGRIAGLQEQFGKGAEWGTLVHRFFESLPSPLPDEEVIRRIAEDIMHKRQSAVETLVNLTKSTAVKSVFNCDAEETHSEERVVLCEGEFMITGVIDRFWKDSRGWHIIDYKTDAVVGEKRLEKTYFYSPQIEAYRVALARANNIDPPGISASILYTHGEPEIVDIPPLDFPAILEKSKAVLMGEPPMPE